MQATSIWQINIEKTYIAMENTKYKISNFNTYSEKKPTRRLSLAMVSGAEGGTTIATGNSYG